MAMPSQQQAGHTAMEKVLMEGKDNVDDCDARKARRPRHFLPFVWGAISSKAQVARLEVMRPFPEPNAQGRRRELTLLAEMYATTARRASRDPHLAEQLRLVTTHVKWAYDIYPLIFLLKNLDLYESYSTSEGRLQPPNRAGGTNISRQSSGISLATMSHSSRGSGLGKPRRQPPRVTQSRLRELRRIWGDGVVPEDVRTSFRFGL
ncbi:hypothetical protein CspeluHIS016_0203920 [Cutaneotrichosporon spelunceum]|uniref:Uncharacterized protein n=1 Tax=Cutaneotrichosporon spelunceum TaxID=1672016 RepID=A0AAD3TRS5_9TREE|nr:hypothetical protein CspeluHIS016_0203920 [Cutaneotrichosporon spelunceum]